MMRKLFGRLGTGTTGRTHTPGATATGTTWADALAASRAWRSLGEQPGEGEGNTVYIGGASGNSLDGQGTGWQEDT